MGCRGANMVNNVSRIHFCGFVSFYPDDARLERLIQNACLLEFVLHTISALASWGLRRGALPGTCFFLGSQEGVDMLLEQADY